MMFLLDLAFTTELITLGVGVVFLIWGYRNEGVGTALAKVAGYVITIGAVLGLVCTTYYGFKYWEKGYSKFHGGYQHMMMKKKFIKHHPMLMQCVRKMRQERNAMHHKQTPSKPE